MEAIRGKTLPTTPLVLQLERLIQRYSLIRLFLLSIIKVVFSTKKLYLIQLIHFLRQQLFQKIIQLTNQKIRFLWIRHNLF